ncbi:alpha-glucan phosphorylase 2, cytosolic-like isoform X2 [Humulus lupulus]|uniref:alpha-glucan phosphorylase 2, cytosolic-like isoform X2 n=1 Tax=Humulus lupulus TaxID=3486 RepID=UPI002B40C1DF|nr:alpha-glucan phosphorylase 2, cytosolic-like isoform X2 [Humulus lupulus]XP_062099055.1 alpha-glucan phosphorylase 2, cytosolic-like isoform X2 [Humulus lupulus]
MICDCIDLLLCFCQRRWIVVRNPSLCDLITKWLGTEAWIRNVDLLTGLRECATDADLQQEWKMVRRVNKMRLAEYIEGLSGLKVWIKNYKNMNESDRRKVVPHVCIIGGKAAPGYEIAKKIIKLCHAVADKINNNSDMNILTST